jgi:hypothetical protein
MLDDHSLASVRSDLCRLFAVDVVVVIAAAMVGCGSNIESTYMIQMMLASRPNSCTSFDGPLRHSVFHLFLLLTAANCGKDSKRQATVLTSELAVTINTTLLSL